MILLPNVLTIGRILLTPIFIICLFYEAPWAKPMALFVFVLASITDAWDGYIARKKGLVTKTGAFLDPLADKILVSSAFISFAIMGKVPYWMAFLIIFRDLFVTGIRMLFLSRGVSLVTSKIAKYKTGAQVISILFVLLYLSLRTVTLIDFWEVVTSIIAIIDSFRLIYYVVFLVTIFTAYTGLSYIYINRVTILKFLTTPRT